MRIKADRSCLLVIDVQERLAPAVEAGRRVVRNIAVLMRAANRIGVPMLLSEHYPKGLGRTQARLRALAPAGSALEKIHFSGLAERNFSRKFKSLKRTQVVVAGLEAHVCVLQTAMDLLARGNAVFLVADAVSSRAASNRRLAIERLRSVGAEIVSTEMVVFEWLERGATPAFRDILKFIR